ncbi:SMI1/KNR4 family protein [Actinoallomurus rhizosphaericola]|uniref:SMI1/KNR4 family protein n=1 Tax=Actinoallomurus rhizosphaericola TaxID=2952536 RepID=UPI00209222C8|nr:SMI1/KNR4 family protein [Actinoallomurus rhizosphaericola]MCO5997695.1 SMI1/KNR4 family protein [Actinoallomurus rhizosphaericola]
MSESNDASRLTTPQEWRSYLRDYSELYLRAYPAEDRGPEQARGWMGREPATEEAVAAAEQRLGVRFPPSYRSFLLTSDGWDEAGRWIGPVESCDEVAWLRDTDWGEEFIEIYSEEGIDDYVAVFQRTLKISNGEDCWFLDPTEVGPDGEFAGYLFEPKYGELYRFASFADLFQNNRRFLQETAADAESAAAGN